VNTNHPLATFGLLLILLVAKLAEYSDPPQNSYKRRTQGFLARRAIDGIAVIGWIADRLGGRTRPTTLARRHPLYQPVSH
jgi:hypothetical protein